MMNEKLRMQFKAQFETQLAQYLGTETKIKEVLHDEAEKLPDPLDLAAAHTDNLMRFRLARRELLLVEQIREALRRIQNGYFGQCEACEEEIELRRLEANPVTTLCLKCQKESEELEIFKEHLRNRRLGH